METLSRLLVHAATLLLIAVALLTMVSATATRDRVLRILAAVLAAVVLLPPVVRATLAYASEVVAGVPGVPPVPAGLAVAVVAGHVGLAVALLRRRLRPEARRRREAERERDRLRERVRVPPSGEEDAP